MEISPYFHKMTKTKAKKYVIYYNLQEIKVTKITQQNY